MYKERAVLILALLILGVLFLFGYVIWADAQEPKFSLNKSEWKCTKEKTLPVTVIVYNGKSSTPIITMTSTCTEYTRF